jgi:hypothetical protein
MNDKVILHKLKNDYVSEYTSASFENDDLVVEDISRDLIHGKGVKYTFKILGKDIPFFCKSISIQPGNKDVILEAIREKMPFEYYLEIRNFLYSKGVSFEFRRKYLKAPYW